MEAKENSNPMQERILINPRGTEIIYRHMQFSQAVRVGR